MVEMYLLLDPQKENSSLKIGGGVPTWVYTSLSLNELLMVTNASVNVLIYLKPHSVELVEHSWPTRRDDSTTRILIPKPSEEELISMDERPVEEKKKEEGSDGIKNGSKRKLYHSVGTRFTKTMSPTHYRVLRNEIENASQQTIRRRSMWDMIEEA